MLNTEYKQLTFSMYSELYDIVVSKNHILRKIKAAIDFSFVNRILKDSYCENLGRPAKEPELMFKLMFLKAYYDLSDRQVVEESNVNMAFKYFLDLNPEDELISPSLLTIFRKIRIKNENVLQEMLTEMLTQAVGKGILTSTSILIDATHTTAQGESRSPSQTLRHLTRRLRRSIYIHAPELAEHFPEKPEKTSSAEVEEKYTRKLVRILKQKLAANAAAKIHKQLAYIEELLTDNKYEEIVNLTDPEAKRGYKAKNKLFVGYKSHVAMTQERVITALQVTSGEKSDGKYMEPLLLNTEKNGIFATEMIADKAYSSRENLTYLERKKIDAITQLNDVISNGNRLIEGFTYNKDADSVVCPGGQISKKKYFNSRANENGKGKGKKNNRMQYHFDVKKCQKCSKRDGCYKEGAKSKTYSITILSGEHEKQKEYQETAYFKERMKSRYKIEAKNGELKQFHGLRTCRYRGLFGMQIQTYFTVFAVNSKRIAGMCQ